MGMRAIISLGSNVEPRETYLRRACEALAHLPQTRFVCASRIIETEPVGVPPEYANLKFLNQIAVVRTTLDALTFSRHLHAIETALGRVRTVKNGPRTIDLDLIDFGAIRMETDELTLPHPRAAERSFVTEPLRELGLCLNLSPASRVRPLTEIRQDIDRIDETLSSLYADRLALADEVAEAKRVSTRAVNDPGREEAILAAVSAGVAPQYACAVREFYKSIFALSRARQSAKLGRD